MQEVILVIHLILAVTIVVLVLIQRSSGGGLGVGGGGGGLGDFATARGAASALSKTTIICAILFFITSLSLAYIGKGAVANRGLLENYKADEQPAAAAPAVPGAPVAPAANTVAPAPAAPKTPEPPINTQ